MNLLNLGLTDQLTTYIKDNKLSNFSIGRITQEHRDRYVVSTSDNEYEARITGNQRYCANSRTDFPSVGDWVTMTYHINSFSLKNVSV
jgi:ribosome biogenesis GTPase